MVGFMGGSLIGIPYWLVAALPAIGFIGGLPLAINRKKTKAKNLTKIYEGSYVERRRKLYD